MRKLNGKCTRSRAVCGILVTGSNDIDQWLMPLLLISFCNLCGRASDSSKIKILPSNRRLTIASFSDFEDVFECQQSEIVIFSYQFYV